MVNIVVLGPPRAGKTHLVHSICGIDETLRPTTCVSHVSCTINSTPVVIWDTPGCARSSIPNLACGIVSDCDVAIVCYDGRKCWSPVGLVHAVGASRCCLFLTRPGAFNIALAVETFDLSASFLNLVPMYICDKLMIYDILRTTSTWSQEIQTAKTPLMDSV